MSTISRRTMLSSAALAAIAAPAATGFAASIRNDK